MHIFQKYISLPWKEDRNTSGKVETKGKRGQGKAKGGETCIQKPTLQPTKCFTSENYLPYKYCFSHMIAEKIVRKFKTFIMHLVLLP